MARYEDAEVRELLAGKVPLPPAELRLAYATWVAAQDDWWVWADPEGWYWLDARQGAWKPSVLGPPGYSGNPR